MQINEFTATRWQRQTYATTGMYAGETLGNGLLSEFGFPDHYKWVYIGGAYLIFNWCAPCAALGRELRREQLARQRRLCWLSAFLASVTVSAAHGA